MAEGGSRIWTPGGERTVGRQEESSEAPELTPEQLAEMMKQLKISDVLVSELATLAQLAYTKLDRSSRDLPDAQLAIEAVRALVGVLQGSVPEQVARDYGQVVSNLQLSYVRALDEERGAGGPEGRSGDDG